MQSAALSLPCHIALLYSPAAYSAIHPVTPTPFRTVPYALSYPAIPRPCHSLPYTLLFPLPDPGTPCCTLPYTLSCPALRCVYPAAHPAIPYHTGSCPGICLPIPDPKAKRVNEQSNVTILHCLVHAVSHTCRDSTLLHCYEDITDALQRWPPHSRCTEEICHVNCQLINHSILSSISQ